MSEIKNSAIACIGWGSLIWDPRDLPLRGEWQKDGPLLPVEFARESGGGRITLVICEEAERVRTCWALMHASTVHDAVMSLAAREGIRKRIDTDIGFWVRDSGKSFGMESETIAAWGVLQCLDGVVWANLPCGLKNNPGMPSGDAVLAHLRRLDTDARGKAEEYVRRAPVQIDTAYRRLIKKDLDWT